MQPVDQLEGNKEGSIVPAALVRFSTCWQHPNIGFYWNLIWYHSSTRCSFFFSAVSQLKPYNYYCASTKLPLCWFELAHCYSACALCVKLHNFICKKEAISIFKKCKIRHDLWSRLLGYFIRGFISLEYLSLMICRLLRSLDWYLLSLRRSISLIVLPRAPLWFFDAYFQRICWFIYPCSKCPLSKIATYRSPTSLYYVLLPPLHHHLTILHTLEFLSSPLQAFVWKFWIRIASNYLIDHLNGHVQMRTKHMCLFRWLFLLHCSNAETAFLKRRILQRIWRLITL